MTPSFMIRKYQPGDREQCRSSWRELTEWHREIYQDPTIGGAHPGDYFDKHLARVGPDRLRVAVHGSQVVGLVGLIVKGEEAEIEPLVVSKAYRHKGIGKQLIRTVVSEARNSGVRFLNVKPVARNIRAIKFLYKQGFKNLGHIELFLDFSEYAWKPGPQLFECKFNFKRMRIWATSQIEKVENVEKVKVVLYGIGAIGSRIAKFLLEEEGVEIVGAIDIAEDKVGKNLGEIGILLSCGLILDRYI